MGGRANVTDRPVGPPGLRALLRSRDFAPLYGAEVQSVLGDQFARVALSVLVFDRTNSAAATALTYAATFLPAVLGGLLLSGVGDRWSPRGVMVGCDVLRAALFAAMAIPGLPLLAMLGLLVVAVFVGPAFSASEVSFLVGALEREQFRLGTGLRMMSNQVGQVAGFALGGVLVAAAHPRGALLADAATYAVSAVVIALALRRAPQPAGPASERSEAAAPAGRQAIALLWRDARLRTLVGLCWLAGCFVVPEGLAVPFGAQVHASTTEAGLLFASIPLGGAVGALVLMRGVRGRSRERIAAVMALATGLPLLPSVFQPHWTATVALWAVSGGLAAYQVEVTTLIAQGIPEADRPRLLSVISAGLIGAQGVGLGLFGAVAEGTGAGAAITLAGAAGILAVAVLWVTGRGAFPRWAGRHVPAHAAGAAEGRSPAPAGAG